MVTVEFPHRSRRGRCWLRALDRRSIKALRRKVVDRVDRVEAKVDAGQAKVEADVEVVKGLLEKLVAQSLQSTA